METIVINADNFIRGVSTDDYMADGGYSPFSKGVNPFYEKGVMHQQPTPINLTALASLDGNAIASIIDPNNLSNLAYILTDTGKFYRLANYTSSGLSLCQTDAVASYVYSDTDMIWFNGALYATAQAQIAKLTGNNLTTIDATWWTTTKGHVALNTGHRHPMAVVEDFLYIADSNMIHSLDTAGDTVYDAMTLPPGLTITAMNPHPNGRDLIVFTGEKQNASGQFQVKGKAFIISTVTLEYTAVIELDDQVHGSKLVGGILYVQYGVNLGYFTDSGIVFLRKLDYTYPLDSRDLGYKHKLVNFEGHIGVVENLALLVLGDLGGGKAFYYPLVSNTKIKTILSIGSKTLLWSADNGSGAKELYASDYNTIATSGSMPSFYTNRYVFPRKVWIRRIEIEHKTILSNGGITVSAVNENGSSTFLGSNTTVGDLFSRIDCNYYTGMLSLQLQAANKDLGIKKITIYYEYGEL